MSSTPVPICVIGLGPTGLFALDAVRQFWAECYTDSSGLNTIALGTTPQAEVATRPYVQFSLDSESLVEQVNPEQASHITGWFSAADWYHSQENALLRPLARLAWFVDLQQGERSIAYRTWRAQFTEMRSRIAGKTVLVFLVADLGDSVGSGLLADVAFFTRVIAAQTGVKVILWAFTVLPTRGVPISAEITAFAALRELIRLNGISQEGHPFFYQHQSYEHLSDDVWRGRLTSRLFDKWNCLEHKEPEQAALQIASVIRSYFGEAANEEIRHSMVNIHATSSIQPITPSKAPSPMIAVANSVSIVLPLRAWQQRWTAAFVRLVLQNWVQYRGEPKKVSTAAANVLGQVRLGQLVQECERKASGIRTQLRQWPAQDWDQVLFTSFSDAEIPNAKRLRFELSTNWNLDNTYQHISSLQHQAQKLLNLFGMADPETGRIEGDAYQRLAHSAAISQVRMFSQQWRRILSTGLNDTWGEGTLGFGAALVKALLESLQQTANILDVVSVDEKGNTLSNQSDQAFHIYRQKRTELSDIMQAGVGWRNRAALNDAIKYYKEALDYYLEMVRTEILVSELQWTLAEFTREVRETQAALECWQQTLKQLQETCAMWYDAAEAQADPYHHVVGDAGWADTIFEKYKQQHGGVEKQVKQFVWHVSDERDPDLELTLTGQNLRSVEEPDWQNHNTDILWSHFAPLFMAAVQEQSLLIYLAAHAKTFPTTLAAEKLREAENLPLIRDSFPASLQRWRGTLLAFQETLSGNARQYLNEVINHLKTAQLTSLHDSQMVQLLGHGDPQRLTYLCSIELLNLENEVRRYKELRRQYLAIPHTVRRQTQIFTAEVTAVEYEQIIEQVLGYSARLLHPEIVDVLYDPSTLNLFWLASEFGLKLISQEHVYGKGSQYALLLSDAPSFILTDISTDPTLLDALRVFLLGRDVHGRRIDLDPIMAAWQRCADERAARLEEEPPKDEALRGAWNRFRQPDIQRSQSQKAREVNRLIASCVLLDEARDKVKSKLLPRVQQSDPVLFDLYIVAYITLHLYYQSQFEEVRQHIAGLYTWFR